jgi:hypothetical protein
MPPFSDYYEPRDWRKDMPITHRERITCAFQRKALDRLFQIAGYERYTPSITTEYGWWLKYKWTEKERREYEKWWVQQFVNQFRTSIKRAENEFASFIYIYAWDDAPLVKPEVKKRRITRSRHVPLLYPL